MTLSGRYVKNLPVRAVIGDEERSMLVGLDVLFPPRGYKA